MKAQRRTDGAREPGRTYRETQADAQASLKRSSKKRPLTEQLEWAKRFLPGECAPFVVAATESLHYSGSEITRESVMHRLRISGRTVEQLRAEGEWPAEAEPDSGGADNPEVVS